MEKLNFAERTARQNHIDNAEAQAPTFEWIWHIKNGRGSFLQWLQSEEPIFWIQGKPGSGKSTLMRYLTPKVEELLNSRSQNLWTVAEFFFDFRAGQGIANNLEGLLRSLSIQIMDTFSSIDFDVKHLLDRMDPSLNLSHLSTLKQVFTQLMQRLPENLCVFVDGLDEYQGTMADLLGDLKKLPYTVRGSKILKICLASRPEPVIALALDSQPGLTIHDHNYEGIERYLSAAIGNLELSSLDESRLLDLSSRIASKADGIFLWARFAFIELIKSRAAGETSYELESRLDELPSDMNGIYVTILKRMRTQDHRDARILFQLVCCPSTDELTTRQIKEAYAIASNKYQNSEKENPGGSIEDFRKFLRAKTGGLIEEVPNVDDRGQQYNTVKTIHRSVNSFLSREGWLADLSVDGQKLTSPESLWVHVCCKYLQHLFGRLRLRMDDMEQETSLFQHAQASLFKYARMMEHRHGESSFQYLKSVSNAVWIKLSIRFPVLYSRENHSDDSVHLDWKSIPTFRESQPWQIMVEQALPLTVEEALRKGEYVLCSNQYDIRLVIRCWQQENDFNQYDEEVGPYMRLLSFILDNGARASTDDIIECFSYGNAEFLKLLLRSWPNGKILLDRRNTFVPGELIKREGYDVRNYTYAGQVVGPLWELVRGYPGGGDFELMLDFLLDRGEDRNEICGPGGTILHALIIGVNLVVESWTTIRKSVVGNSTCPSVVAFWKLNCGLSIANSILYRYMAIIIRGRGY